MNLKLVYRVLRKISDWTVYGFYSDVYVQGTDNVPTDGPIIIASNHANEIIDVAALAVTIPQRRHVSFWAKSTLFTIPVFRSILSSSGAIPVQRNPNRDDGSSKAALFKSSSLALASGEVIGVFSEGASYTEPTIVQVLSGTAWAAVEYTRWRRKQQDAGKDVVIIPVGLVYTDKATFDSGLRVQYGTPIAMSDYIEELFDVPPGANPDDVAYRVVQKVTSRIEQQLFAMTINASDWDTLYAAETLRAMAAPNLALKDWVSVSQQLVDLLSDPAPSSSLGRAKDALIKYYSLLHYTSLSHSDLVSLPSSSVSRLRYITKLAFPSLSTILLAPFYAPALLIHIPACVTAELMVKVLSIKEEPEGFGQYRAVGGGVGAGIATAALLWYGRLLEWQPRGWIGRCLSYLTVGWLVLRCYGRLAPGLHRRLKRALASYRILLGVLSPRDYRVDVGLYSKVPPPPPSNAFIRRHGRTAEAFWDKREKEKEQKRNVPAPVAGRKLVRAVLEQREETERVVKSVLEEGGFGSLGL